MKTISKGKEKEKRKKLKSLNKIDTSDKIVNITANDGKIKAENGYFETSFYFNDFYDGKKVNAFIKNVEKTIRTSDEYSRYIDYLKNEIGLDYCMVMPNIDDDKASIEMHHGPILTLYDYCEIIVYSLKKRKERVNTFIIANLVLKAHYANIVQVVMLSKTTHSLVHEGKIFIHPSQAWGDLNKFLELYGNGMSSEQIKTFNTYVQLSKKQGSCDNGILEYDKILNWRKSNDLFSDN